MKKVKNKEYLDKVAKRHHKHDLQRKNKYYNNTISDISSFQYDAPAPQTKTLPAPQKFSLILNPNETLEFFKKFMKYSETVDYLTVDTPIQVVSATPD